MQSPELNKYRGGVSKLFQSAGIKAGVGLRVSRVQQTGGGGVAGI